MTGYCRGDSGREAPHHSTWGLRVTSSGSPPSQSRRHSRAIVSRTVRSMFRRASVRRRHGKESQHSASTTRGTMVAGFMPTIPYACIVCLKLGAKTRLWAWSVSRVRLRNCKRVAVKTCFCYGQRRADTHRKRKLFHFRLDMDEERCALQI